MGKIFVLYDDPYFGAATIYGTFKDRESAEARATALSTDPEIWGPSTNTNWRWNYEIIEVDLE